MGDDRDHRDQEQGHHEDAGGHPLGDGALSSIRGRRVTGSTSLTSLLEKRVPRRRTPTPAAQAAPAEASEPAATKGSVASDAPPVPGTREPTARIRTDGQPPRRGKARLVVVAGGLCIGAALAWFVARPAATDGATAPPGPGEARAVQNDRDDRAAFPEETPAEASTNGAAVAEANPIEPAEAAAPGTEETPSDPSLAALPTIPPEILAENTWVRRNRAEEVRTEARRLYVNERWEDARRGLLHSLEWDPSNVDAQRNISRTYQRQHDMEEALAWTRRAITTAPNDPRNHELLGDQLLMMGQLAEASVAYRAGLAAAPNDVRLRSRLRRMD